MSVREREPAGPGRAQTQPHFSSRAKSEKHSVAAIIPLYNGAKWIEEALRSVLSQTRKADEIIVVDDGSADNGAGIVAKLAEVHPEITLIRQANAGQSAARNRGIRQARSNLIALLDQDDVWYPDHIEILLEHFMEAKAARKIPVGWVYSDLDEMDEHGNLVGKSVLRSVSVHPKRNVSECVREDMFILPGASLISREAVLSVGGFDERLSGYEDDDLFLRLFRAGWDHRFVDQSLSKWRIFPYSCSGTIRMCLSRAVYAQKLLEMFPDDTRMGRNYGRDLIVPRFLPMFAADLGKAAIRRDLDAARAAIAGLRILAPTTTSRQLRLKVTIAQVVMRVPVIARLVIAIWRLSKRMRRR
jgi:glycosyltransferase involved in cell wall biosynthesis